MKPETLELKSEFTAMWLNFAAQHQDDMQIGDWVHLFSTLSGTAMAMAQMDKSQAGVLAGAAEDIMLMVHEKASEFINKDQTPLQ